MFLVTMSRLQCAANTPQNNRLNRYEWGNADVYNSDGQELIERETNEIKHCALERGQKYVSNVTRVFYWHDGDLSAREPYSNNMKTIKQKM